MRLLTTRQFAGRPRIVLAAVFAILLLGGAVLVSSAPTEPDRSSVMQTTTDPVRAGAPAPTIAQPPPAREPAGVINTAADVEVETEGFFAWAAVDRTTGETASSDNSGSETSSTESMIKAWLVADYLRLTDERGDQPSEADLRDASRAIRDSHNGAAERLYRANGRDASVDRMVDICELTATHTPPGDEGWWSRTEISALDAARLGECLVDGRAAGPEWTDWLLDEMRQVRGSTDPSDQRAADGFEGGRWGIIDGLPPELTEPGVSMKNGWTRIGRTNSWHLACLAVTDDWVMAVLMRYPADLPLDYGAQRCAAVAEQLTTWPTPEPVHEMM